MAKRSKRIESDDEPGLDISSLIDVCFLLLIYFIVATSLQQEEKEIRQTLPNTNTPSEPTSDNPPLEIDINNEGIVSIVSGSVKQVVDSNPENRSLGKLNTRVKTYALGSTHPNREDIQVQITVSGGAKNQRFIDVLNIVKRHNIPKVAIAVASGN